MILLILFLFIVLYTKMYNKEAYCKYNDMISTADNEIHILRVKYREARNKIAGSLQKVRNKQNEINSSNNQLDRTLQTATAKYDKTIKDNIKLTEQYNSTIGSHNGCIKFNQLKLNAIKKIYS